MTYGLNCVRDILKHLYRVFILKVAKRVYENKASIPSAKAQNLPYCLYQPLFTKRLMVFHWLSAKELSIDHVYTNNIILYVSQQKNIELTVLFFKLRHILNHKHFKDACALEIIVYYARNYVSFLNIQDVWKGFVSKYTFLCIQIATLLPYLKFGKIDDLHLGVLNPSGATSITSQIHLVL